MTERAIVANIKLGVKIEKSNRKRNRNRNNGNNGEYHQDFTTDENTSILEESKFHQTPKYVKLLSTLYFFPAILVHPLSKNLVYVEPYWDIFGLS